MQETTKSPISLDGTEALTTAMVARWVGIPHNTAKARIESGRYLSLKSRDGVHTFLTSDLNKWHNEERDRLAETLASRSLRFTPDEREDIAKRFLGTPAIAQS